ncbi:MAG: DUF5710 domain-containing protein [Pseudonocardia sp.]
MRFLSVRHATLVPARGRRRATGDQRWRSTHQHAGPPASRRADLPRRPAEKDDAKALGARWDPAVKRWCDPSPQSSGLDPVGCPSDVPDLLPGEDRTADQWLEAHERWAYDVDGIDLDV